MNQPHVMLWALFILGQLMYIFIRMAKVVRDPRQVHTSRRDFLAHWWDVLLIRGFIASAIFWVYVSYPLVWDWAARQVGIQADLTFPVQAPLALMAGLAADFILHLLCERISWLKRELPDIPEAADAAGGGQG